MKWIVEHLRDGAWSQVVTFNTRDEARSAIRAARRLKAEGEYRYVAERSLLPDLKAIKQAEALDKHKFKMRDLWGYFSLDVKQEIESNHGKWCASDCGMKWLRDELLAAGVDLNR